MKKILYFIILLPAVVLGQTATPTTITKGATYTGVIAENLTATQSIMLGTGVFIKQGSTFSAKIVTDAFTGTDFNTPNGGSNTSGSVAINGENYIYTRSFKKPMQSPTSISQNSDVAESITYFDGLGRPEQSIAIKGSATSKDIVTHIEYDAFGRQVKEFLPYVSPGGNANYDSSASSNVLSYYSSGGASQTGNPNFETTTNPYSEKLFEASSLNRVLQQAAPGNDWVLGSGHEVKLDYQTNNATEVKLFKANATWNVSSGLYDISISDNGSYTANQLYKTVTKDENWTTGDNNTTQEFKNKEGQMVLKRTFNNNTPHDTYYVYDQYGNQTYVLSPLADGNITQTTLDGLAYQYKYDYRNRLVEKKIPGKQWEFMVYDKLDRVVATGPALASAGGLPTTGWMITKYDIFNRPIYTGWEQSTTVSSAGRTAKQAAMNALATFSEAKTPSATTINGVTLRYSNGVAPTSFDVLTVNYYDDYDFPNAPVIPSMVEGQTVFYNTTTKPKGLPTGSWVKVLSFAQSETSYTLYDYKARPIRTYKQNYLGGYTQTDSNLDFVGKPLYTITRHKRLNADPEMVIKEVYTYSAQDRLLTHTHQINSGVVEVLASNTYDELGQLISKNVGGLQKVDYAYNIRGWLKGINDVANLSQGADPKDLFTFGIYYNAYGYGAATKLYNGNINSTAWRTGSDNRLRSYSYSYDNLNRLNSAYFQNSLNTASQNNYGENVTYDKNGNILTLDRTGDMETFGISPLNYIDKLTYNYSPKSNQLLKVFDSTNNKSGFADDSDGINDPADDYTYDTNGNITKDDNKKMTFYYNHLNLLTKVGANGFGLYYIYNALGQKVQSRVESYVKDQLDGFEYSYNLGGNPVASLLFFPTAEGFVRNTVVGGVNTYTYVYNYTDHLGNVRVSYEKDATTGVAKIVDERNYYPFGLQHKGYNAIPANSLARSPYQFNGKEPLGFGYESMIDFGARNYMADIGRTSTLDPLAEKFTNMSPYSFLNNNPLSFIDPSGMAAKSIVDLVEEQWNSTGAGENSVWTNEGGWNSTNSGGVSENRTSKEENAPSQVLLSAESFYFQETTSNWQAAGVTGLSLSVEDPLTRRIASVDFELEVGLPLELNNRTVISQRIAKISSAQAANETAAIIGTMADLTNGKFYKTPALVKQAFATLMQTKLNKAIIQNLELAKGTKIGSRVNSPIQSYIIKKEAIWNNESAYKAIKVWMKSWF
jgi:RHS repeat-associated protein